MTYPVGGHWGVTVITAGDSDDVLTVAELLERARIVPGDAESDALLKSYIGAAIEQVQRDIGYALPTQTIAATFAYAPAPGEVLLLPMPPLQTIDAMTAFDASGAPVVIDAEDPGQVLYIAFECPARVVIGAAFFPGSPLGTTFTLTVGYTAATIPPALKFAVGLLATHYLTAGRDRVVIGTSVLPMPAGYAEVIDAWRLEILT